MTKKIDQVKDNATEIWKTLKSILDSKGKEDFKDEILFSGKLVTGGEICERFNEFFIDSIGNIAKSINHTKTPKETVEIISIQSKMEKFDSSDGITISVLKAAFETI
ncbi:unnamed protein product [Psylliodes chrysocephalus]|uniref:Uncharacterized protein n=1 Tax=Psylliodes chrysocephalus TaxID=3402493 RepID=A0A9P0CQN5_9CUCU|nr:unnamed protein product [Psylliodes chrysocephala]